MITATRYHDISCGHRVYQHESKCAQLHGHNYRIHFTIKSPELDKLGRVIDFGVIKNVLCSWLERNWDHRFLIWEEDPWYIRLSTLDTTVIKVPFNPTAENIGKYLVEEIAPKLMRDLNVELIECKVDETRKCSATYIKDNKK